MIERRIYIRDNNDNYYRRDIIEYRIERDIRR